MTQYRGVRLKKELIDEVEETIKDFPYWRSIAEFVSESIRRRLEEVKKSEHESRSLDDA